MAELRTVDPHSLKLNPDNPRRTPVPKEMDQQLVASIKAIGLLQPPVVREIDGELVVRAGDRRTRAAIAAELLTIDVYVLTGNEDKDAMASMSENLVRVGMNPIDTWRAIDCLEQQGWNEEAIGNALALSTRTVRKLKLLGKLHPPMLDVMAKGSMPNDGQLRTIANAPLDEQAQVWKKFKPKKGQDVTWWEVARALEKRHIPFSAAKFGKKLAEEYGVVWVEDLFAPADEDSRTTTNAEGFLAAQRAWMEAHLPPNGTLLTIDDCGSGVLPKGAQRCWGKPTKTDKIGHYVDPQSGEIATIAYRPAAAKKKTATSADDLPVGPGSPGTDKPQRPDVTQNGIAMIGDLRTDALHQAIREVPTDDTTLIALLVLALSGNNVSIASGDEGGYFVQRETTSKITEGGALTADTNAIRTAAREMLAHTLSCRENRTRSGVSSRIAGAAIGADAFLPTMATEEFLSCLSRQALERAGAPENVLPRQRVKDTRAALVAQLKGKTWIYPAARFALTEAEITDVAARAREDAEFAERVALPDEEGEESDGKGPLPKEYNTDPAKLAGNTGALAAE